MDIRTTREEREERKAMERMISEYNEGKLPESQLRLGEAHRNYIDPDYGEWKRYGAWGLDGTGPYIMFSNMRELEAELNMLTSAYQEQEAEEQNRRRGL